MCVNNLSNIDWITDLESRILNHRSWITDPESWILCLDPYSDLGSFFPFKNREIGHFSTFLALAENFASVFFTYNIRRSVYCNWTTVLGYLMSISKYNAVEFCRFEVQVVTNCGLYRVMQVNSPWLSGMVDHRKHVHGVVRNSNFLRDDLTKRIVTTTSC